MSKRIQEQFRRGAAEVIRHIGGTELPDENSGYRFHLDTKYGLLRLHVDEHDQHEGPGTVFACFENATAASTIVSNRFSGKWNLHYFDGWTVEAALKDLEAKLRRVLPTSLDGFMTQTSIVPIAVVETVLEERAERQHFMSDPVYVPADRRMDHSQAAAWFFSHVERRAILLYDINRQLHKLLRSENGRDVLYAFVHHWLDAYLLDPIRYRKEHPPVTQPVLV
jgi:hypothetical protein